MSDTLILATTAILMTAMLCWTALSAWRSWLALRQAEARGTAPVQPPAEIGTGQLIELAAVKERLRRLEALANLVEP